MPGKNVPEMVTSSRSLSGVSLVELLVGLVIASIVCTIGFLFFRNFLGNAERQRQVESLQNNLREATESINRYLISSGMGGNDSVFRDPSAFTGEPIVNKGCFIWRMTSSDSDSFQAFGNFSGTAAFVSQPVLDKASKKVKVDNPAIFKTGHFAYISGGPSQEVLSISSIGSDSTLNVSKEFLAYYPKGTLLFPLEKVRIQSAEGKSLRVERLSASGAPVTERIFAPTGRAGDKVDFKITRFDLKTKQIQYELSFSIRNKGTNSLQLERKAVQNVYLRGY